MPKTVWITSLTKDEDKASALFKKIHDYGLSTNGHFWVDDLEKMAWAGPAEELCKPETAVWLITGTPEDFAKKSLRQGLSLLALLVAGQRGHGFPILLCPFAGEIDPAGLPLPLRGAEAVATTTLGPKLAARANTPFKPETADYRLRLYPMPGLGLWFEAGPAPGRSWKGVIFGTNGVDINAHGVGPAGKIPERATLHYPIQGMRLTAGDKEYQAWGVANDLTETDSYFVRVTGAPAAILFGEMPEGDAAELFTLALL
ncbi:MAG: hypothetical protein AB9872_04660 [Solidesulfovibrio sp.]